MRGYCAAVWLLAGAITAAASGSAFADIRVDITQDHVEPVSIAVPPFVAETTEAGSDAAKIGSDVAGVVSADLERSGLFTPIDPAAYIQHMTTLDTAPRFSDWRTPNAQALVQGAAETLPDGRIRLAFRLWDVFAGKQLAGTAYVSPSENWRRIGHIIADEIYKKIIGEDGYFDSRIVYVSETGSGAKKVKRLAIMDQDGANQRMLTDGSSLVSSPRFSPVTQEITYISLYYGQPRAYLYNIDSGHQELLGDFPGMTIAPRFSPDGNKVILFLNQEGNSGLYEMDLRTRHTRRLANRPGAETMPCYAPDGQQIVYVSDRGGSQNLFVMNGDGSRVHRISYGEGRYAMPVWSPRGDLIAFTKVKGGQSYIGVMKPDGTGERMLSAGYLIENPTWSPNGRVLLFYRIDRAGGDPALFSIDLTGFNERRVVTTTPASDPAWSPLLP